MKNFLLYLSIIVAVGMGGIFIIKTHVNAEEVATISDSIPEIYIRAINPGYSVGGKSNVGEIIEISRKNPSDTPISLAGINIRYTNSSGEQVLAEFPEYSYLSGENLLLRLASSPGSELANLTYKVKNSSSGLTQSSGPVTLTRNEEILDSVCWEDGVEGCYRKFKSGSGESLVRNLETGEFEFSISYEPKYNPESYYIEDSGMGSAETTTGVSQCRGMEFSEILSYYESSKSEQFVELYNRSSEQIKLDGCILRYKNKNHVLSGIVPAEGYHVYYPEKAGFALTKNPNSSNTLELIDTDGAVLDKLEYPNGQRKGTAYAFIGYDGSGKEIWRLTYAPTPGSPNNYQEYKTCEEGKVINKETGNCVKVSVAATKVCKEGQYLNPLTGRCKKIETQTEKTCKEGYYLNPETNRCRKIKENKGADYSLEPETTETTTSFVAIYAVLGVLGLGLVYLIYEYRSSIRKLFYKVFRRFR